MDLKTGVNPSEWGRYGWSSLKTLAVLIDEEPSLTKHIKYMNFLKLFLMCILPCLMCRKNVIRHLNEMIQQHPSFTQLYFIVDGCKIFVRLLYQKVNLALNKNHGYVVQQSRIGYGGLNEYTCRDIIIFLYYVFKNYKNVQKHEETVRGFVCMIGKLLEGHPCDWLRDLCLEYAIYKKEQIWFYQALRNYLYPQPPVENKVAPSAIPRNEELDGFDMYWLKEIPEDLWQKESVKVIFKIIDYMIHQMNNIYHSFALNYSIRGIWKTVDVGNNIITITAEDINDNHDNVLEFIHYASLFSTFVFKQNTGIDEKDRMFIVRRIKDFMQNINDEKGEILSALTCFFDATKNENDDDMTDIPAECALKLSRYAKNKYNRKVVIIAYMLRNYYIDSFVNTIQPDANMDDEKQVNGIRRGMVIGGTLLTGLALVMWYMFLYQTVCSDSLYAENISDEERVRCIPQFLV